MRICFAHADNFAYSVGWHTDHNDDDDDDVAITIIFKHADFLEIVWIIILSTTYAHSTHNVYFVRRFEKQQTPANYEPHKCTHRNRYIYENMCIQPDYLLYV